MLRRHALLAAVAAVACSAPRDEPAPPAITPEIPAPPALRPRPVLTAESGVIELPVEGHAPALAAVPLGTIERSPVAVVAHGNWGGPQWECPLWRGILGGFVFVLCPRGVPRADQRPVPESPVGRAYTYESAAALRAEIDAGLRALRERFGAWMADGPVLYAGCSLGAAYGVALGSGDPARFPRLALVEGGHDGWTDAAARRFVEGGGERVLFACGQYPCFAAATAKAKALRALGVDTSVVYAPGMGHACHDRVASEVRRALPWLVADDARWRGSLSPR